MIINKKVGFRLIIKVGEIGIINFGKVILIVGGLIGGLFDVVVINRIGNIVWDVFVGCDGYLMVLEFDC